MRRSLLTRLIGVSVLVAIVSITATAWLAVRTTKAAIEEEQGGALADDSRIYDTLLGFAATHSRWSGVRQLVEDLADQTDRRIALRAPDGTRIADSSDEPLPLPNNASAILNPLSVNPELAEIAPTDGIDLRAVGPFQLATGERARLDRRAQEILGCVRAGTGGGSLAHAPSGRPRIEGVSDGVLARCGGDALAASTPTERAALSGLQGLVNDCLARQQLPDIVLNLDLTWRQTGSRPAPALRPQKTRVCIEGAREEQLLPYVAPPAQLYVTTSTGAVPSPFALSSGNEIRIAVVVATVLLMTVTITVFAGTRLIRPLRELTDAAARVARGELSAQVAVRGEDEVARLGEAFNAMVASREHIEQLRTSMVGDIAHELRTPVSNIRGWLEAAEDGISPRDPALISSLLDEALLLQHVIDDLQDLAVADAGQLRFYPELVWLGDVLEQIRLRHEPRVAVTAPDDLTVVTDPVRLRQMLNNLITNAIRHTPDDTAVSVEARHDDDEVVIDVADTGTGISPRELPHVFDRFWRAEKSRNREGGGSGLGLAIVRKLSEAQGGSVAVTSSLGVGSTFTLRLPAAATHDGTELS